MATDTTRDNVGAVEGPSKDDDVPPPVTERSVPKPVFTDAEAGAREFPSSSSRSYNYFTPAKRRATVYEDVTVDVQPDPDRHLLQGWIYGFARRRRRLPAGVDRAEVVQLARVPRPQRGVGADDLPQQRERGAPDQPEPGQCQGGAAPSTRWNRRWIKIVERHVGAWAHVEHGIGMHVYTARPARRADEHDQQRAVGRRGAQAALRAGPHPLQPRPHGRDRRLRRPGAQGRLADDPIWQGVRENVERLTAVRRLGRGVLRRRGRVRAAGGRAVPLGLRHAGRRAAGRLRHPDADGRRRVRHGARARVARRAVLDARRTTRSTARRTRRRCRAGWRSGRRRALPPGAAMQPIWSQPGEKVIRFEESLERSRALRRACCDIGLRPRRRSTDGMTIDSSRIPRRPTAPASR